MGTFIRICQYILKNWPFLLISLVCMFIAAAMSVQIPKLTSDATDVLQLFGSETTVELAKETLLHLTIGIIGLTVLTGILNFVQGYASTYFSQKVIYEIRNDVFASLQNQSFAFYGKTQTGQLLAKVTTDVERIRFFLSHQLVLLLNSIFLVSASLFMMATLNIPLTLMVMPLLPLLFFVFYRFGKRIRPLFGQMREQYGTLTSVLHENLMGIRVVRAFAQEKYEKEKFRKVNNKYFQISLDSAKIRALYIPLTGLIVGIGLIIILWYGGSLMITEPATFNVGNLLAFTLYLTMLVIPMRSLSSFFSGYQLAMVTGDRIFGIIDAERDIIEEPDAVKLPPIKGHVVFENVSFEYEKNAPILKNINLEAKPGETIALLGTTGSGKSTIIRLIPRFYDVSRGRITVDGYDVRAVNINSLREQIGIVSQETFLFTMTIRENIAYGKPRASTEAIVAAAKAAKAHEFISKMPMGYDSRVGERGVTLSVGQRQRIAIARALLVDPKILILDDSTSSVDVETEYEIQQALKTLLKDRTAFMITQRVSTIRDADKIVVLTDGEISEEGTHEALMARKGGYYQIYQTLYEAQKSTINIIRERARGLESEG